MAILLRSESYEYRYPVSRAIKKIFPHLLNKFEELVQIENPSMEIAEPVKLICKMLLSSSYGEIDLFDSNIFNSWMVLFLNILERPVPLEGQPTDPDHRKEWGWWKVKEWTLRILNHLYTCLLNVSSDCAKNFHKTYAGQFMECHLNLLSLIRGDGYLPDRISILILEDLSFSIRKTNMYYLLQPKLDIVLFEIVFPLMCFNDDDQRLWEEDPHEYMRSRYDDDFCSPRKAATDFVIELVRNRGEENLQKVIYFIVEVFKRYDDSSSPFYKSYRQKDGALLAMGVLHDQLEQTDPYKSELEGILVQHVFPEFSNTVGHLRAKAVWVAGIYASNFSPNNFQSAFGSVHAMMKDPDLYVRVEAVLGFHSFVKACKDLDDIRPTLPQLLEDCVERMNEVENEDLLIVYTLLLIVKKLGEEVAPYAYALCQNLAAALWKCVEEDHPADVAVYCLQAISAIIQSISSLPYLVDSVEPILGPIMRRMWTTDQQDVCEEIIEIESYFSETISLD